MTAVTCLKTPVPMKTTAAILLVFTSSFSLYTQPNRTPEQDSILAELRRETQTDYQHMLHELGIVSIRQGANGRDPAAPNAANYDEDKANPYPVYPDLLTCKNGTLVTTSDQWWSKRRVEIMEDFDREIYGRTPTDVPAVHWEITEVIRGQMGEFAVTTKKLSGHADNSRYPEISVDIDMTLTTPANAGKAVPVIIQFGFNWPAWMNRPSSPDPPQWQLQLLEKGWGFATLMAGSIQADNGAGLTEGIIGLVNKGQRRSPEDWGTLKAWAWGASRALDYFESDPDVDERRVGITGHSRYGKAAIVTMAYDDRFAIGYISSSGAGGVKPHRRNYGELVENVAGSNEYHWMAGNYIKYAGPLNWDDLPVDSHELLALCAPRPVFVGCGDQGDGWVDPRGMFMACVEAGPAYRLLGKSDLGTDEFPSLETALIEGDIAFRQHAEGHTPAPNWATFIQFADRYFE